MANLPSLYEYYTGGGINHGLSVNQSYFTLNNKYISLYSGSMHYFRVPPEYWRDRLRKMRAAGLNAVQTYVPWNLHEPQPGHYDFGSGGTDMQDFLHIKKFLKTAKEEDLFVIMRPGPFICAEFEFGGLPSWLLREPEIKFRTHDEQFMKHVTRYFMVLLSLLSSFQFTKGGPIISFQVENEYGSTEQTNFTPDKEYLRELQNLMKLNNITELLFTSDDPLAHGSRGSLPSLFQTANFGNGDPTPSFDKLKLLQDNKPSMATEYWAGWFNHWSENPYVGNVKEFSQTFEKILSYPASVNLYMFHGGTSWGFLNGANMDSNQKTLKPDVTSYDYDAPLSENGNYTEKYYVVKSLLKQYNTVETKLPAMPAVIETKAYDTIKINEYLAYKDIVGQLPEVTSEKIIPMEMLPMNNFTGQQFGYIIYRKRNITLAKGSALLIKGYVYDTVNIYINNQLITNNTDNLNSFGYWKIKNGFLTFDETYVNATLDLVVCNMGRNNFGSLDQFYQYKGLKFKVTLDNEEIRNWEILSAEFKKSWTKSLAGWKDFGNSTSYITGAALYKANLVLNKTYDTFINMEKWKKGIVIVNNFVLGRYWKIGPQQYLYLPAPLLKEGNNTIIIFDEFSQGTEIVFSKSPEMYNLLGRSTRSYQNRASPITGAKIFTLFLTFLSYGISVKLSLWFV